MEEGVILTQDYPLKFCIIQFTDYYQIWSVNRKRKKDQFVHAYNNELCAMSPTRGRRPDLRPTDEEKGKKLKL